MLAALPGHQPTGGGTDDAALRFAVRAGERRTLVLSDGNEINEMQRTLPGSGPIDPLASGNLLKGLSKLSAVGRVPSPGPHTNPHLFDDPSRCPPLLFELQELRIAGRAMSDVLPHLVLREFLPKGDFANHRILRAPYTVRVGIVRQDCVPNRLSKTVVFLLRCICHRSMPLWQLGNRGARPNRPSRCRSGVLRPRSLRSQLRISARTRAHYLRRLPMEPHPCGVRMPAQPLTDLVPGGAVAQEIQHLADIFQPLFNQA
jgi:hypothetical protein